LARVGDATLTQVEVRKQFEGYDSLSETELRQFVQRWANEELLYQEARRKGIEDAQEYKEQLDQIKKQIACQQFLERSIYADTSGISDSASQNYFNNHREEFSIREETVKLQIANFATRDRAASFAAYLARGISWDSILTIIKRDSLANRDFLGDITPDYYTEHTLFPAELWKIAATLGVNDISFPVKLSTGYSIVLCIDRKLKGDSPTYEVVSNEVKERLSIEKRRNAYTDLLENLHKRYRVETFINKE
jgi:peptidyl-prolyl cis-trans isomerase C